MINSDHSRVHGNAAHHVEYIRSLPRFDAHCNWNLETKPSAVHVRLDLVPLFTR